MFAEKTAGLVHPLFSSTQGTVGQSAGWHKVAMLAFARVSHIGVAEAEAIFAADGRSSMQLMGAPLICTVSALLQDANSPRYRSSELLLDH